MMRRLNHRYGIAAEFAALDLISLRLCRRMCGGACPAVELVFIQWGLCPPILNETDYTVSLQNPRASL